MDGTIIMARPDRNDWTEPAIISPNRAKAPDMPAVPVASVDPDLGGSCVTGMSRIDLSERLQTTCPATTPNLLATFLRVAAGEKLPTRVDASAQLFLALQGHGRTESEHGTVRWDKRDLFVLPRSHAMTHFAIEDSVLIWVHDGPLMEYLGAAPVQPRFRPALFRYEAVMKAIRELPANDGGHRRGVWLAHEDCSQVSNATHTIGVGVNTLPGGTHQKPLRHNAATLTVCTTAKPGTYTLVGDTLNGTAVAEPRRLDWRPGACFVLPPGKWHSHHNESDWDAVVFTIQDAGLLAYERLLDLQKL